MVGRKEEAIVSGVCVMNWSAVAGEVSLKWVDGNARRSIQKGQEQGGI